MGLIFEKYAREGLDAVINFFRVYIPRINDLSICEIRMLIVSISPYLYCRYYKYGEYKRGKYEITADTMYSIFKVRKDLASIAYSIVNVRNMICHKPGSSLEVEGISDIYITNKDRLISLLLYESIIDNNGHFIEPNGGGYEIADVEAPDKTGIANAVLDSALRKMSGDM